MKFSKTKIRASAKGKPCTVQLPGVCNRDPSTTVYAHAMVLPPTGIMGGKHEDVLGGYYACRSCHDTLDGRNLLNIKECGFDIKKEKLFFEYRAVVRTWRMILEEL